MSIAVELEDEVSPAALELEPVVSLFALADPDSPEDPPEPMELVDRVPLLALPPADWFGVPEPLLQAATVAAVIAATKG